MGQARLNWAVLAMMIVLGTAGPAAAQSRFLSFGDEAECLANRRLSAPLCRAAFANAMSEFAGRTQAFASLAQCSRTYGDCAPWPPGTASRSSFRPRFAGVDIVDTPREKSVTPSALTGLKRLSFQPQPLTEFRNLDVRGPRRSPRAVPLPSAPVLRAAQRPAPLDPAGAAGVPPRGSGFKLEDGVLTYPAPERFQPKNLPRQP